MRHETIKEFCRRESITYQTPDPVAPKQGGVSGGVRPSMVAASSISCAKPHGTRYLERQRVSDQNIDVIVTMHRFADRRTTK